MTTATEPRMVDFPLDQFHQRRILYAVNHDFLWPLGLALAVTKEDDGTYSSLKVVEWGYDDGHHEAIDDPELEFAAEFRQWVEERRATMPPLDRAILDTRHGT